jgi:hypothetical protein
MNAAVFATEGWAWIRCARRRIDAALVPAGDPFEDMDRHTDLAQGLEALDRALRYAEHVLRTVHGTELPDGVDWPRITDFARRARDAVVHGDERIRSAGLGYHLRMLDGTIRLLGKAKHEKQFRTDLLEVADLQAAVDALTGWLDLESTVR